MLFFSLLGFFIYLLFICFQVKVPVVNLSKEAWKGEEKDIKRDVRNPI